LSNPSIVRAPYQEGVPAGSLRFIMSLRAIGEGHLSSIQFRSGIIDEQGRIGSTRPASTRARRCIALRPTRRPCFAPS
jgi:hypothetical protein